MAGKRKLWRWLLSAGSLLLAAAAALHLAGYGAIAEMMGKVSQDSGYAGGVKAVWVLYSVHLILLAFILLALAWGAASSRPLLFLCGLFALIDAALLVGFVGIFPGALLVLLAALLTLGAMARHPSGAAEGEVGS